jgi:DNA polymerase elongation subunit (family B)
MLEGIYNWIVFLPNVTNGAGALNRYYGCFRSGETKVRGIALRRTDTPEFMRELQRAMLGRLSESRTPEEFVDALPQVVEIALSYANIILDGSAKKEDLILTKRVSMPLAEYRQRNESYAALAQMHEMGFELAPGQKVRYLACEGDERVRVEDFIDGTEEYDRSRYADLALRAASEMISPFGYDLEEMRNLMGRAAGGLWTKEGSRPRFRTASGAQAALGAGRA